MNTPGFRKKMRRLIWGGEMPYREKARLFELLARSGPEAAWFRYKRWRSGCSTENGQISV
jgi:hypothetical protein